MTGPEGFLSRWTRLKREAAESRETPPNEPRESSADASASSSTNGPRAVLMSNAPVFILPKTSALNSPRVAGINGAWMETKSEISSNRSKLTPSTPAAASACGGA